MEKLLVLIGGLVLIVIVITAGACSYYQTKMCNDRLIAAIESGNAVLAASMRCYASDRTR